VLLLTSIEYLPYTFDYTVWYVIYETNLLTSYQFYTIYNSNIYKVKNRSIYAYIM